MKIKIIPENGQSKESLENLLKFINKSGIEGLDGAEVDRGAAKPGEMGAEGILGSISAIIHAAEKPLVELVKCLQKYVDNYRTKIVIPTKKGDITISHGKSMTATELKELITSIKESDK
jgi:hypothetical protein